jgi:hypothetical protein
VGVKSKGWKLLHILVFSTSMNRENVSMEKIERSDATFVTGTFTFDYYCC